jgi:beta-barrel assembly-enhancing protease
MSALSAAAATLAPIAALTSFVLISVDLETRIGREAQAALVRKQPRVTDAAVAGYVQAVGRQLAPKAEGPRFPYSFDVADAGEINAFALPGGPVWVHRGALAAARTEAELAGVIAHEIAHIALRHPARQISGQVVSNLGLSLLSALLGNSFSASTTQAAAEVLAGGMFLKFSRDDEREADGAGAALVARAGWDPHGLIGFMEVVRAAAKRDPSAVEVFFSTHPAPEDRIARLHIAVRSLPKGRRDSRAFASMQRRLAQLPPPRRRSDR